MERHAAERPVLQLVRPPHRGEADDLAADRRAAGADPLLGRQRLAGRRAARGGEPRARAARAGPAALRHDELRLLLPAGGQPDPLPLRPGHRARRPAATTRSSPRAGSRATSGSRRASSRRATTTARTGPSPTSARTRGSRRGRSASRAPTSASDVYEGAYPYDGTRVTPSWGGSMFEALMPALFLPEEEWGPGSWGPNHPLTVRAQIHHGLIEAGYGYWGFSPANVPEGGYAVYGVDAIGMDPNGNPSNEDRTLVDRGFPGCPGREPKPDPPPSAYTDGVVTPHAAFLALRWAPRRDAREPRAARARLPRPVRAVGLPRQRQRRHGRRLRVLPVARPGDDHGRDRQRARGRRAAARVRHPGHRAPRCARWSASRSSTATRAAARSRARPRDDRLRGTRRRRRDLRARRR